jgi:hypothetical protein
MNALSNARHAGEKFATYRARLKVIQHTQKRRPPHFLHAATQIVHLPVLGIDAQVDAAVLKGDYRDAVLMVTRDGKEFRIARTKGVPYRRPADTEPVQGRGMRRRLLKHFGSAA